MTDSTKQSATKVREGAEELKTTYAQRVKDALSSQRAREVLIFTAGVGTGIASVFVYGWAKGKASDATDDVDAELEADLEA